MNREFDVIVVGLGAIARPNESQPPNLKKTSRRFQSGGQLSREKLVRLGLQARLEFVQEGFEV